MTQRRTQTLPARIAAIFAAADAITVGSGANNYIFGGAGPDNITSGEGHDLICGDHCYLVWGPPKGADWATDYLITVNSTYGGLCTVLGHVCFSCLVQGDRYYMRGVE